MNESTLKSFRNARFLLESATLLGIIGMFVLFSLTASILPAPSPPEGSMGLVAKYGMHFVLFAVFVIGGVLCGVLFLLSRFPRLYRYPVPITAENIEIQYHIAKIALCVGQLITVLVTCLLMVRIYRQNITMRSESFWRIVIEAGAASLIVYMIYYLAARKYR